MNPNSNSLLDQIGNTPLVELRSLGRDCKQPVLVKCEHLNPGGSVKDRIAKTIVEDAEQRGVLRPGSTVIEATAGNTGLALALVCAVRGYRLVCVMPERMSEDKRAALRALGVELVLAPNEPSTHPENFRNLAKRLADENGWYLTEQFDNPANVRAHEDGTGPEILVQCEGKVGAFVSGAGSGGTITGVGRFLKQACPTAKIVLADPPGSILAGFVETGEIGEPGPYEVEGIGSGTVPGNFDRDVVDFAEVVPDEEGFAMARRAIREEGLLIGGSAGTNLAAAIRVAMRDDLDGPVVTVGCDSWDRYRSCEWMRS